MALQIGVMPADHMEFSTWNPPKKYHKFDFMGIFAHHKLPQKNHNGPFLGSLCQFSCLQQKDLKFNHFVLGEIRFAVAVILSVLRGV